MKKVIALALTLAMVLAMGVVAFADNDFTATITGIQRVNADDEVVLNEIEIDSTVMLKIEGITADMKVTATDANGFMTFGAVKEVAGAGCFVVEATATKLGVTKIVLTDKDGKTYTGDAFEIVKADEKDPVADKDVTDVKVNQDGSVVTITVGKDGFTGADYNEAVKYHPEEIKIVGNGFEVVLYRGDYVTKTQNEKDKFIIKATVSDKIEDSEKEPLNNRVLTALGNNKADPFYVTVESVGLDALADKPVFTVDLDKTGYNLDAWVKTNNVKAMAMYSFDEADDTVAVVASNIKVNNRFDNVLTMPTTDAGVYVFVDATNAASSSANVKDNVSTGANDMMAVAVVFATIALAAGVSKKVR